MTVKGRSARLKAAAGRAGRHLDCWRYHLIGNRVGLPFSEGDFATVTGWDLVGVPSSWPLWGSGTNLKLLEDPNEYFRQTLRS